MKLSLSFCTFCGASYHVTAGLLGQHGCYCSTNCFVQHDDLVEKSSLGVATIVHKGTVPYFEDKYSKEELKEMIPKKLKIPKLKTKWST